MEQKRHSFSGRLGFVLAAAGSAVGLGNIWRFPYLAAKYGGGLFLVVYLTLALTFGFALLTSEVSIGRLTKQSPLTAYTKIKKGWKFLGVFSCVVPMIILPYYCVIGGWVVKYLIAFATGHGVEAADPSYFGGFITANVEPQIMMLIFMAIIAVIIVLGVQKGIEASSKIIMPILFVLVVGIAVYAITLSFTDAEGTRTGLQGLKILVVPDFSGVTLSSFASLLLDAMGQLFYSLSIAMGIMVAYGSYVRDEDNLAKSVNQIEICDTGVAFLAGVMVIPTVFVFQGKDGLGSAGPGLMFKTLPQVFASMGKVGNIIGFLFFAMVLFAALTSAMSILEAVVCSIMDQFHVSRLKATIIETAIALVLAVVVNFGYNIWYFDYTLPNGSVGQILDIFDYVSNNVLMPIVALSTCILIGWVAGPEVITTEITKNGEKFARKGLYNVMTKYVAPILLIILFIKSIGLF